MAEIRKETTPAPVARKGEQGGTTAVKPVTTPKPVVTQKSATATPKVTAANVLAALGQSITNMQGLVSTLEPKLQSMAAAAGVAIDAAGNVVPITQNPTVQQNNIPDEPIVGTKDVDVLKAVLKSKGIPAALVDDSVSFLTALKKEGLDNDSITDVYLNNKDFTTKGGTVLTSPFYSKYGFYNDALTDKYSASELFNAVEGYKDVATRFNLDSKFTSTEYTQKYLKNKLSVAAFNENANQARLAAVTADSSYVEALKKMGYISGSQGLTDFFMDPDVGVEKMKQNVNTASIALEAVRRSNADTGLVVNAEDIKKYGAALTAQGLTTGQVAGVASKGYATVAANLQPMTKLTDIYNRPAGKTKTDIQKELEQQEFQGIESTLQKRLAEQEVMSFSGRSGLTSQSLSSRSIAGQI
jgi:hypothetical protein